MDRWGIAALAAGLALIVFEGASAHSQAIAKDDGYDSATAPAAREAPMDPAAQARYVANYRAEGDAQRKTLSDEAGKGHVQAMINLAALLEYGDEQYSPDRAAAFDLYEKAADKGDHVGQAKMCVAYLLGEDRPKTVAKGMTYCNGLDDKDGVALWAGGYDYQNGISGPKDDTRATNLYLEAVKAGSGEAADALGREALDLGKPDIARQWFRHGVFEGSADAMDDLAKMVEAGQGGPQDKTEAGWLYVNAARLGNGPAHEWLTALASPIEPLPLLVLERHGRVTAITETYKDKAGTLHTLSLDKLQLGRSLENYYPPAAAMQDHVDGSATMGCYVGADHRVDVCLIRHEFPPGYGFGRVLEQIYDGQLTLSDRDVAGQPTDHSVFALTLAWELSGFVN